MIEKIKLPTPLARCSPLYAMAAYGAGEVENRDDPENEAGRPRTPAQGTRQEAVDGPDNDGGDPPCQ